jgi:RNA polymerase sigma-70 factor (family 1)
MNNKMNSGIVAAREKEILLRLRADDQRAFEEFYKIYSGRIYRTIVSMIKDREVAQELLQDVFIKVWEKRLDIDPENSFQSYLFTISRNMVYNYLRRTSLKLQIHAYLSASRSELYTHVEEEIHYKEIEETLNSAILRLPAQRRKIFILCKIDGKSYEEVSKLLGISTATINDHIVKATHFLKIDLGNMDRTLSLVSLLVVLYE